MKICDVIDEVMRVKRGYEVNEKQIINGIETVEQMVFNEIVLGREGEERYNEREKYTEETSRSVELKIQQPYCKMYVSYCEAMIDSEYDEIDRYQNDMMRFNQDFKDYAVMYSRTHRQINNYNYNYGGI